MKHNRVLSIVFAVITAVVLILSPVSANVPPPPVAKPASGVLLASLHPYPFFTPGQYGNTDYLVYCVGSNNCNLSQRWYDLSIKIDPSAPAGYDCILYQFRVWWNESTLHPKSWAFNGGGQLCENDILPETDSKPRLEVYPNSNYQTNLFSGTETWFNAKYYPSTFAGMPPRYNQFTPYFDRWPDNGNPAGK